MRPTLDFVTIRAFLEERHAAYATRTAEFAARALEPLPEPMDDAAGRAQAREILRAAGQEGWFAAIGAQDLRAMCLAREAFAAASPLADAVFALQALSVTPLLLGAPPALRDRWVPEALAGRAMGAFVMTEPEAGSDVAAIAATAVRDGDAYVLNGEKTFISNAGIADFHLVFASTDRARGNKGLSLFLVAAGAPGLEFAGAQVMSAPHPLGRLRFRDCRVPAEHRLGEEGEGFKLGMATLDRIRPSVGAAACGMAGRALAEALRHAASRRQFGKPLAEFQLVQEKLGRMAMELTAARLLVYRAAWEKDGGAARITLESAMAKAYATEAAQRIVDDAVQILGGQGVLATHPVDRLYRSVRALRIYEGTTEIQHLIIASHLLRAAAEAPAAATDGPAPGDAAR